jgi:magnesium-protoporphyrin O-methyltransferase
MDCCRRHQQGLDEVFGKGVAKDDVRDYLKHGVDRHARQVVNALAERGVSGASVLEVGGGVGGLHLELLKRGAAHVTAIDVSSAYLAAAQDLAAQVGRRDHIKYRRADFVEAANDVSPADVVVLHRVVCCYPDMPTLVTAAAQHTQRLLSLTFPQGAWYMRLSVWLVNLGLWLGRSGFRIYVHPPAAILATAEAAGLRVIQQKNSWPWRIVVFERA